MDLTDAKKAFFRESAAVVNQADGIRLGIQVIQAQDQLIRKLQDELEGYKRNSQGDASNSKPGKEMEKPTINPILG